MELVFKCVWKELFEIKEKEVKDRERYLSQINGLKKEVEFWKLKAESLKHVKETSYNQNTNYINNQDPPKDPIISLLNKKIEMLIKKTFPIVFLS